MYFLIGVGILIVFVLIMFFYIRYRIRRTLDSVGFAGKNLKDIIEEAKNLINSNQKTIIKIL